MQALIVILLTILASLMGLPAIAGDVYGQDISPDVENQLEQAKNFRLPNLGTYDNKKAIDVLRKIQDKNPDYYRAAYNLGLAYWNDKDYKNAKSQFDLAIGIKKKFNLDDVTVFNSAGWVSMRAGDYTAAENYFKEGLKEATAPDSKSPMDPYLYTNLGTLYYLTQRFDDAEKYLTIARDTYDSQDASKTLELISQAKNASKATVQ
jgi:tetratricopeptide (TPR) repeat protein